MALEVLTAPTFPLLNRHLLRLLRESCRQRPFGPKWVIVPSSPLANRLRIVLGRESRQGIWAGVRILSLPAFLHILEERSASEGARRWSPLHDFLLYEMVLRLPESSRLADLKQIAGGHTRLIATFRDLADGGFGPAEVGLLKELAEDASLKRIEQDTLEAYVEWLLTLERASVEWQPLVHQGLPDWIEAVGAEELAGSLAAESGLQPELFLYGFYDFTDVNLEIMLALARRLPVVLLFPGQPTGGPPNPAYSFSDSVLEDVVLRSGSTLHPVGTETPDDAGEVATFFLSTFPEGAVPRQPGFLTFHKASGVRAEVISAAIAVRGWLDASDSNLAPEEIMVVAPQLEIYCGAIREIFSSFAIPFSMVDLPGGLTRESYAVRMLTRIWEDRAPVEWILSYFREFPDVVHRRGVDLESFEGKIRELALWGDETWKILLKLRSNELEATPGLEWTDQEWALVEEIAHDFVPGAERLFPLREAREFLLGLIGRWLEDPAWASQLVTDVERAARHDPSGTIPESVLRRLFASCADTLGRSESMDRPSVTVLPLMRSRGLTVRGLVVLGLASGRFPIRVEEDAFLSDASRGRLARSAADVGHRLSVKMHTSSESLLLFLLLNTSAERVHWVIPETDELGKAVSVTPWAQRYLQAWRPHRKEQGVEVTRIPRAPSQQAILLHRMDPDSGGFLPPSLAFLIDGGILEGIGETSFYAYLSAAQRCRIREPHWSGWIPSAAVPNSEVKRVTVTQLEWLSRCPYRFYVQALSGFAPLEPLRFSEEPDAMRWGNLLHSLLEQALKDCPAQNLSLETQAARLLAGQGAALRELIRAPSQTVARRLALLPPILQAGLRIRLWKALVDLFRCAVEAEERPSIFPKYLEVRIAAPFPGIKQLELSGKIDRIDERDDTPFVIDYKSGKPPAKRVLRQEVELGFRMQPHLYPWLYQSLVSGEKARFAYLFLGGEGCEETPVTPEIEADQLLASQADILAGGYFFATSNEWLSNLLENEITACNWCEYMSLCRRFESGAWASGDFLRAKAPKRVEAMRRVAGK